MADLSGGYENVIDNPPGAQERIDILSKPLPPPPDHPMIQFAQGLAAPMTGPVGPTGPQGAYPYYPTEHYNRSPAEQDALLAGNRQRAGDAYAAYAAQRGTHAVGPTGPMGPDGGPAAEPPSFFQQAQQTLRSGAYGIANAFGSGELPGRGDGSFGDMLSGLTHVTRPDLYRPDAENNARFPGGQYANIGTNAPIYDVPGLGGLVRQANEPDFSSPLMALGPEGYGIEEAGQALKPLAGILSNRALGAAQGALRGEVPQFLTEAAGEGRADLGLTGPAKGPLGSRIVARSNEQLAAESGSASAAQQAVAADLKSQVAQRQIDALRKGGASEEDIAAFQKTMAPAGEVGTSVRRGTVLSAEGQQVDARTLTRSLQTAVGTEGVPLSQHPVFSDYGASGKAGPKVKSAHGGDIGTATRAVMAGDPGAIKLLGDNLTNELIQNKVADIVRKTGAPEDVIRRGLGILVERDGAAAADAAPGEVLSAAKTAAPPLPVGPAVDYSPLVTAMRDAGASDAEIAGYVGKDSSPAAAPAPRPVAAAPADPYVTLVDQMRAAGASEDEIAQFLGRKPPPPPPGEPPTPPIGGKDGLPTNLPRPSSAEMASAIFRNYVVSNSLSPFTLAIKAGADLIKTADTTLEAITQGARAGRPAQIPGSVGALYSGFWRGITQDAVTAFKNREYALTAAGTETKTNVIDQMLSGKLGNGPKRFAQAGEVLSLGSPIPRTISALTSVFQRGYRDMALYQEGYAQATARGLKGAAADQAASQFMTRPTAFPGGQAALERATNDANTRTWTNSNPVSRIPGRDKPVLGDALFTITPFVNLVTNIAREGTEYIPGVGLALKGAEAFMKGGKVTGAEWTRVVQHQFMGAVGTLILAQKAAVGEITGNGPDDDNRRFAMIDQGWKPNHIKIGDNWYPNIAFGPLAPLLNFVGNTHDNLVLNTTAQDRSSTLSKVGATGNALIKAELDSAHWLDSLMDLASAVKGTDADKQNFVARWLGLFTPQSGSLKAWERVQEPATPAIDPHLTVEQAIGERYWRQYPPMLRPPEYQALTPGTPRADTGAAAVIPYLGTPGDMANLDGVGVPEGDPNYQRNPILIAAQTIGQHNLDWRKGGVIEPPSATIGSGQDAIRLDPASARAYIQLAGQMRDRYVGAEIFSSEFQNATSKQQETLYDKALAKADSIAKTQFFAHGIIDGTDPQMIQAQAVAGFKAQQTLKDRAYWVALLDRSGKLTPQIAAAIDGLKETLPDQKEYISTAEYRTAAPRVHEFLSHVPYGTDAHPIGTPADWAAVEAARAQYNLRTDQLVRGGARPSVADQTAKVEVARSLSQLQRGIFLNPTLVENPERRRLAQTYGTMLTRFLGSNPQYTQESGSEYTNFPFASR